ACGTALVFCNVFADGAADPRVAHCARPVDAPHRKFGCNVWLTDVTMQAHAISAPPRGAKRRQDAARGGGGGGILCGGLLDSDSDAFNVPPPAALVGLAVRKLFPRHGTFSGTVVSHHASLFRVLYSDGDEEDVPLAALAKLALAAPQHLVGRRVSKHFPGLGRFEGAV
ncbi:hypothetical protein EMIHUDRAFT_361605, partial [Emiliania huxleyi CCMP1516]|uniref:PTM/DIR17-like Tudor domain-containing protein n=2 Tax=Emiliania huxleyi TaxID=2903 RepID=A0A0D3KSQ6_EMIH1